MNDDLYHKLVDLYAGNELPQELNEVLESQSILDRDLRYDMASLRMTHEALHSDPGPEFTEESYQRILMKMYARGVDVQPKSPTPMHLQYRLPING